MHALSYIPTGLLSLFFAWYLLPLAHASSYFVINQPAKGATWVNNAVNPISWTKGLLDGVTAVDIELARLSEDGLIFVARDVPAAVSTGGVNILIQDIPTADDYFLLFVNSTNGIMYASSPQFTISDTANGTSTPVSGSATVTVSGGPNPTAVFATTFPPSANGAVSVEGAGRQLAAVGSVMALSVLGGVWAVL
ncbi:uncharacterized protein TRAVEDRAFT_65619 [Trametes versicolor FP-101664 SS1]|uniref:uncharacterized protein n=1 Tax=Trametes versicolor (strain FP-101664) TaxID=717944 RepID=UPI000462144E|nr:uncharacterized protein TRAVEDRAFT_65619 [Trametes versicolor FP-101664 SS1]EIW56329.1 hypothetical protein TRAVEDRAFT_65619 [Trametes versicolor FP-101664 SS1]